MHERAIKSKSDSNIKSARYRSTNHLLHSPSKLKATSSQKSKQKKKKPLSLQNSQDKSTLYSVTSPSGSGNQANAQTTASTARTPSRNYLNSFYDELRQKLSLFPLASNNQVGSTSGVNSTGSGTNSGNKQSSTTPCGNLASGPPNTCNTVLSASNTVSTNVSASVTHPSQSNSVDVAPNDTTASTDKILPF